MIAFENDVRNEDGECIETFSNKNLDSAYKKRPNNWVLNVLKVKCYWIIEETSHWQALLKL